MAPVEVLPSPHPLHDRPAYYSKGLREKYRLGEIQAAPFQQAQKSPDIGWQPNLSKYLARSAARIKAGGLQTDVPDGWPKHLDSPLAWKGVDFENEEQYILQLSSDEILEIESALKHFKGTISDIIADTIDDESPNVS
jgi:hypothetical protein